MTDSAFTLRHSGTFYDNNMASAPIVTLTQPFYKAAFNPPRIWNLFRTEIRSCKGFAYPGAIDDEAGRFRVQR
jgi:hypothetical protein